MIEEKALAISDAIHGTREEFDAALVLEADPGAVAVAIVRRFAFLRQLGDLTWVGMSELVYLLASRRAPTAEGVMPLWRLYAQDPSQTFGQFARDELDISAPTASQLMNIWDTFVVKLGWDVDALVRVGKSKLQLALGSIRREIDRVGDPDPSLMELLVGPNGPATFDEIERFITSGRRVKEDVAAGSPIVRLSIAESSEYFDGRRNVVDCVAWRDDIPRRIFEVRIVDNDEPWPWQDVGRDLLIDTALKRLTGSVILTRI